MSKGKKKDQYTFRMDCDAEGWCFVMGACVNGAGSTRGAGFHVVTRVNHKTHEQRLELVYGPMKRRPRQCPFCKGDPNARYKAEVAK